MVRVLEVLGRMDRGGAEAMIMNLYRKIDRNKVQFDFMVHTEDHCQFDDEIRSLGGRIFHVPRFRVFNYFSYKKAWKVFFQNHPEIRVVHGHMGATAAIYLHEANKAGCFTIAHSHSAGKTRLSVHDIFYSFFSFPTRYIAKQLFGCSTEAGRMRFGKAAVSKSKYKNFQNAIDLQHFTFQLEIRRKKRDELGISENQPVIVSVGRITTPKNPEMIFETFKEITIKNSNAVCLWVGTGEFEDEYRAKIKQEGLEKRIIMTGVRKDVPAILQAADSFLFPSLWEGLPVSVIEAQATGLPCVISDTISKEVEITNYIEWLSLKELPTVWADRCLTLALTSSVNRKSPVDEIRKAGYDIDESVIRLQNFYLEHGKFLENENVKH